MQDWVYAGKHNGLIQIENSPLYIEIDNSSRAILYTLKLQQHQYDNEKDQTVGKHNLFVKNYIRKFKFENVHYFEEQAQMSTSLVLVYQVFIQKTIQGLEKIVLQHERLNTRNRPRRDTPTDSNMSSTFSDTINKMELKGENRFTQDAYIISSHAIIGIGSQSKIPFSKEERNMLKWTDNSKVQSLEDRLKTQTKKTRKQEKVNTIQDQMVSPVLPDLDLKKLISQEVSYSSPHAFNLSPHIVKISRPAQPHKKLIQKIQTNAQRRRKLMQDFELKKLQFKKKLNQTKQIGKQLPKALSQRKFSRTSSTRSLKSVRLTQLQKTPQQKPWDKKQRIRDNQRNKKIMYFILFLMLIVLYVVMKPNRNYQIQEVHVQVIVDEPIISDKSKKPKHEKQKQKKNRNSSTNSRS